METHIVLKAIMKRGKHLYEMCISQGWDEVVWLTFPAGSMGWLNMQVAKDSIKDSIENVIVHDETEDPR